MQASSNEPTLVDVMTRLDKLAEDVEKYQTRFEPTLVDVITRLDKLTEDFEKYETRFEKLDNRLWTLSLALVTTAWAAIFAAAGVVIFRSVVG